MIMECTRDVAVYTSSGWNSNGWAETAAGGAACGAAAAGAAHAKCMRNFGPATRARSLGGRERERLRQRAAHVLLFSRAMSGDKKDEKEEKKKEDGKEDKKKGDKEEDELSEEDQALQVHRPPLPREI